MKSNIWYDRSISNMNINLVFEEDFYANYFIFLYDDLLRVHLRSDFHKTAKLCKMFDLNQNFQVSQPLLDSYEFRLPSSYIYADYIWPGNLISEEKLKLLKDFKFQPNDILIVTYPKSGTTWLSEVVSLICHKGDEAKVQSKPLHERVPWLELDNNVFWVKIFWIWQVLSKLLRLNLSDKPAELNDKQNIPRVFFTHLPLELLPKSALQGDCKIIYVSRNAKDNAVSFFHFHQMARFLGQQKTTWDEFFALYTVGKTYCGSWFEHVLSFWRFSKVNKNVLFMKYEDMKFNLREEVIKICKFLDQDLSEENVDSVVKHCEFSSMKENRMANREGIWLFNQKVSKFMRKGTIGDWKNYFTVSQNEIFDKIYQEKMNGTGLEYVFDIHQ